MNFLFVFVTGITIFEPINFLVFDKYIIEKQCWIYL